MQIIIEQGNEFNYKIGDVKSNDIFINEYNQAALRLEEIVTATKNYEEKNKNNIKNKIKVSESDFLNNIIAFTGERGQGKSSAMHSFSHDLLINCENSDIAYGENTKISKFKKLDTIDPSTFEDINNVLDVVIARMFNDFQESYKDDEFIAKAKSLKILESFQKVYESLNYLRNPKKLEELESDYEGSIQKIARIGDSTNLKKEMSKLVDSYLKLFIEDNGNSFLIIPIDDLDINIEYAYKISEQIRKYLVIPHVIIIMAVKIEQLKQCAEMEYRTQLEELLRRPMSISRNELVNMAAKYVEKLIPDGRKISLPEIRAISQSGKDAVDIIFKGEKVDNILEKYKSNKSDNIPLGIEKTLLAFIYDKTGIVFVKPENSVHPIVPNTLRELVNILSVLGKMKGFVRDSIEDNTLRLQNIKLFEDYFMYTWVPTNLDDGHIRTINELWHKSTFEKHQFICLKIMDMLENTKAYTVDEKWDKSTQKDKIKQFNLTIKEMYKKFSEQNNNCLSYSVGDVASLLDILSTRFIDQQIANFVFAVKTIYTITMNKLAYSSITDEVTEVEGIVKAAETENTVEDVKDIEPNDIYKFVGGDLWGATKKDVIRKERGKFEFRSQDVIDKLPDDPDKRLTKIVASEIKDEILYIIFFSNCPSIEDKNIKEDNYEEIVYQNKFMSRNYRCKERIEFSIDNLFISPLDLEFTYTKSGLQYHNLSNDGTFKGNIENIIDCELIKRITVNYELNEYVKQYCIKTRSVKSLKEAAYNKGYLAHFIFMIRNCLKQIDYIRYFENDYYIIAKAWSSEKLDKISDVKRKLDSDTNELISYFIKCLDNSGRGILSNIKRDIQKNKILEESFEIIKSLTNLRRDSKYNKLKENLNKLLDCTNNCKESINFTEEVKQLNELDKLCIEDNANDTIGEELQRKYFFLHKEIKNKTFFMINQLNG